MDKSLTDVSSYLDLNGLANIALQSKSNKSEDKQAALEQAAKQFESIFTQMLLKSMRQAEDVLAVDSPFNSQTTKFYRDMHDQQLAMELSSQGSLGLAPLIVRQLGGDRENFTPKAFFHHSDNFDAIGTQGKKSVAPITNNRTNKVEDTKAKTGVQASFQQPKDFVQALTAPAKQVEQQLGIPYPVVIAQAALETGWGQKMIRLADGKSSNNLFNIKADNRWQGDKVHKTTLEFEQGSVVKKNEPFRVYQNIRQSVDDYINFLSSNERYQEALGQAKNVEQFLHNLSKAGYATDPNYANKIMGTLSRVTSLLAE